MGPFLIERATVVNKKLAKSPIKTALPNGNRIKATHTYNLDIQWLPNNMTKSNIVPGLAHSYIISTHTKFNTGCQVAFDMDECCVYYKNNLVLEVGRDLVTELWCLTINPTSVRPSLSTVDRLGLKLMPHQTVAHGENNVHTILYKQNKLKYMHQIMFFPPITTLIKAIDNEFLEVFPFIKSKLLRTYLAKNQASEKGREKRLRKGIRSTRAIPEDRVTYAVPTIEYMAPHLIPDDESLTNENP